MVLIGPGSLRARFIEIEEFLNSILTPDLSTGDRQRAAPFRDGHVRPSCDPRR
jgi:hypothetical protein